MSVIRSIFCGMVCCPTDLSQICLHRYCNNIFDWFRMNFSLLFCLYVHVYLHCFMWLLNSYEIAWWLTMNLLGSMALMLLGIGAWQMSSIRSIVLGCVSEHGQQTPDAPVMQTPKRISKYVAFYIWLRTYFVEPLWWILIQIDRPVWKAYSYYRVFVALHELSFCQLQLCFNLQGEVRSTSG